MKIPAPIVVTARTVFGVDKIYPVSHAAQTLAKLTGKVTLNARDLELAKDLGLTVLATGHVSDEIARFPRAE